MIPTAVIWDLGGVLVRWRPELALAAHYGGEAAALDAMDAAGFKMWNALVDAGAPWDEIFAQVAAAQPDHAGIMHAYRDGLALAHREAIAATVAIVERLDAAGVPQYGLSNAAAESVEHCQALHPFMARFVDVAVSATEKVCKPEAAIYTRLLERNGLTASACVFIDDSAPNVAGAEAVGLRAIHFTSPEETAERLRDMGLPA
jgi:2-haloacid dehalogenase